MHSRPEMKLYLKSIGYSPSDLNVLSFIHVAGTKGKGSTCCFASSMLGKFATTPGGSQIKTGLYSSPHLVEVRERIRIDGVPLSKAKFAKYFFKVWDNLEASGDKKPAYFRYMTLLSFHAFMEEKVDAVILEVGIGGEYDCTNVIESPTVIGISCLGYDHQALLGYTIQEIAWHKAGIMKKLCPAFSVPQPIDAIPVIEDRKKEIQPSKFSFLTQSDIDRFENVPLGLAGKHQKGNAALAVALVKEWIAVKRSQGSDIVPIGAAADDEEAIYNGLQTAQWPGRCQTLKSPGFYHSTFYLDGAHTPESLLACASWFSEVCSPDSTKAIIFNCTHQRPGSLLFPAMCEKLAASGVKLSMVLFSTNDPFQNNINGDLVNNMVMVDPELEWQHTLKASFLEIATKYGLECDNLLVTGNVEDAVKLVSKIDQVLITGSLHLVGSALAVFSPETEELTK